MRLLIDGDACPNLNDIRDIAKNYLVEMIVYHDYAHEREDDYYQSVVCEVGSDSVDIVLLNDVEEGDLVITQDYGLASLCLMKKAIVLHVSGKEIRQDNIDNLLMSRYLGHVSRKGNKHVKGPKKRTNKDKNNLLKQVEKIIINKHLQNKSLE